MRRLIASILALSLLLQASASDALAQGALASSTPPLWETLVDAVHPLAAVIYGSYSGGRRNAPPGREIVTPAPIQTLHPQIATRPIVRSGVQLEGPHMLAHPLRSDERPQDPRSVLHKPGESRCSFAANKACAAPMGIFQHAPSLPRTSASTRIATAPFPVAIPTPMVHTMPSPPPFLTPISPYPVGLRGASVSKPQTAIRTMSVQQFQYEADTSGGPSALFATGSGAETGAVAQAAVSAPTGAQATETLTFSPTASSMSFGWITTPNVPGMTSWPAQNYQVTLNVTQPNANLKITAITLYRVDANGGPSTSGLAQIAGTSGLNQSLGGAGTLTWDLSGVAQTASATDRLGVKFTVIYSGTTTSSFGYLAGSGSNSGVNVYGSSGFPTATTGFNPWWSYYSGALPGQGSYALNVGNGNLLAKTLDFDTPERGVDLAFQRVYNSQSAHDASNDDGSVPGSYGDGWTSSFDAHIAYHGSNTISVYDIDGTRSDYNADGNGNWTPPAGQYASLKWDGSCGYQWFKPDGSVYYFYSPDLNAGTPSASGVAIVQKQTGFGNSTASLGVPALPSKPTPGNVLVLAVGYDHTPSDVSTSLSGWTYVGQSTNYPTFWNTVYIWEKIVQNNDTGAATITSTSAYNFSSVEYEISGEDRSSPYEGFSTSHASSASSLSVVSGTASTANDLPVAFFENRNYTTSNVTPGWTEDATATSHGPRLEAQHGPLDANSSAQTAQLTWSTPGYPVGAILLIRPAGQTVSCTQPYPQDSAYGGRLYQIWGRNYNNKLTFTYSWTGGDASNSANLAGVTVTHSDGDAVTLTFGTVNGSPELSSVRRVDGKILNYFYNGNNLSEADLPGTNGPTSSAISTVKEEYQYGSGHLLSAVVSPNYVASGGAAGNITNFQYDASNRITKISDSGVVNVAPSDGTGTSLQSGSSAPQTWTTSNFTYVSGETELSDMYMHYTNWLIDSSSRVTQLQRDSFNPQGSWVSVNTGQSWDSNNNLLSTTDPRGMTGATPDPTYETDYAYDSAGDLVAAAQPTVSVNNGTYRPTYVYSYDGNHNVTAVCDPVQSHALGLDWSGSGQSGNPGSSSSRCPSSTGSAHYVWDTTDASEPYGRVTNYYTPNGYHYTVAYNAAAEGNVDAGLPTLITGDAISQAADASTPSRTPTQSIAYDAAGNAVSVNNGTGTTTYAYDAMHRGISVTDADSVSQYVCFNDNGSVLYTETAAQHAADGSPAPCSTPLPSSAAPPPNAISYTYDADGNSTAEVHHYGNITGTTTRWYDAGDRLVESQLPLDPTLFPNTPTPHDLYPKPWMARYLYDNVGGSNWIWADGSGNGVYGDGHLYKVQEYLPSTSVIEAGTAPSAQTWTDVRGWAWDPLDVPVHVYEFALGNSPRLSYTYNGSNSSMGQVYQMFYGQGPSSSNPAVTPTYASNGWLSNVAYANDGGLTPAKNYTYDADGRATTLYSSVFGNEARSYDHDGNLTNVIEPSSYGGYGNIRYAYFGDDLRQSIAVSSSSLNGGATETLTYGYRGDALPEVVQPSWAGASAFAFTYTSAGRASTESDPDTGKAIPIYNQYGTATGNSVPLVKRQSAYDAYGRLAQLVLPEGYTYGSFTYDGENEITGYTASNGLCNSGSSVITCAPSATSITYSARGEMLASGSGNKQSADGFLCTPYSYGCREKFDSRNGMVYTIYDGTTLTYTYDSFGRNTAVGMYGNSVTRAYDADSHLTSQKNLSGASISCPGAVELGCDSDTGAIDTNSGVSYTWGTNGHPVETVSSLTGSNMVTSWEHWDPASDTVLFENPQTGNGVFALGHLGVSNVTNGVTVEDHGLGGHVAAIHTASQFSVWGSAPMSRPMGRNVQTLTGGTGSNFTGTDPQLASRVLDAPRPDLFLDPTFGVSFQGVRTADPNSGAWMSPDWFGGYDRDVMSQQPYVWNRNDGLLFQDPSGFSGSGSNGCFYWNFYGPGWGNTEVDCPDNGFAEDLQTQWDSISAQLYDWGNDVYRGLNRAAVHVTVGGQVGFFGGDFTVGTTLCGQTFYGFSSAAGIPFTPVNGSLSGMIDYAPGGSGNDYLGNGWSASGGVVGAAEMGGAVSRGGPSRPSYYGLGLSTPSAQLGAGTTRPFINVHACGGN